MNATLSLVVRRTIAASRERLFEAWTTPAQLRSWWGPRGVRCTEAEVDARAGGRYRLANALPGGEVVVIEGEFLEVEPPSKLVYTWRIDPRAAPERVTVRFEGRGAATEVIVVHERIADEAAARSHEEGWIGCLERLEELTA